MTAPVPPGRPAAEPTGGLRLRLARLAAGLSQEQLAAQAKVSRQAVAGIEGGRFDPSLRVALDLAAALGRSVEDLFAPPADLAARPALLVGGGYEPPPGLRVDLAELPGRTVAFALSGDEGLRPGFHAGLGQLAGPAAAGDRGSLPAAQPAATPVLVETGPPGQPAVVVAGCDPALGLLAGALAGLSPPRRLVWWPCNSAVALDLAAAGLVHAAGVHLPEAGPGLAGRAGGPLAGVGAEVLGFGAWDEGLAYRPGTAPAGSLEAVVERGLRLVNREPGSEARQLLDDELARLDLDGADLAGYSSQVRAHLLVASAVAAGLGDVGITMAPAAAAYGLDVAPLAREAFQLVLPRPTLDSSEARALLQVLSAPSLRLELARLPGYDASSCGVAACTL